ncbi:MAG: hypothetical protein A3E83_07875 [Gammaproteobacteria bacterium RIFCSPHIGHO2_12_FULL_41_20]|nr:MAG: hypothetical protein A3E83_07875 [Gammaproteobacteria bacterium RIFCSPHIGHO2_12_FULL_41_20]
MYRIIGVLAIIGFIVILLPFVIDHKGDISESVSVGAPPFPNQSAVNTESSSVLPVETGTLVVSTPPVYAASNQQATAAKPVSQPNTEVSHELAEQPPVVNEQKSLVPQSTITSSEQITKQDSTSKVMKDYKKLPKKSLVAALKKSLPDRSLLKFQASAWVIQLGSFKNKANAIRLVDQLRNSGYKAFIQNATSHLGETIRVYVGPETRHASAKALADRLEQDLHLHGIVVSFKPLAL